jgi:predicted outer membrane repeat protein
VLNLTLSQCTLSGNSAHTHNVDTYARGGAIFTVSASTMLTACTLSGNSAASGGAIFSSQDKGNSLTLNGGCIITGNSATSQGGGIYIYAGDAFVQNTSITSNSAGAQGGGLYNNGAASIQNTSITNNSSGAQGGGIFNDVDGTLTLYSSSLVSGNSAPDGADVYNLGRILRKKG